MSETAEAAQCLCDLDLNILWTDHRYQAIVGRPQARLAGVNILDLTHPDDRPANAALLDRLREGGPPFILTKQYMLPTGGTVWVMNHVSLVRDGPTPRLLARCRALAGMTFGSADLVERWRTAKTVLRTLRAAAEVDVSLRNGPGLPLLLELYVADVEGRELTLDDLRDLLSAYPNLLSRWIDVLVGDDLIEVDGASGGSATRVALTAFGAAKLDALLTRCSERD